jgi:hypothetical protein
MRMRGIITYLVITWLRERGFNKPTTIAFLVFLFSVGAVWGTLLWLHAQNAQNERAKLAVLIAQNCTANGGSLVGANLVCRLPDSIEVMKNIQSQSVGAISGNLKLRDDYLNDQSPREGRQAEAVPKVKPSKPLGVGVSNPQPDTFDGYQRIALALAKVDLTSLRLMQIEDNPCAHLDCNSIAPDKVHLIIAGELSARADADKNMNTWISTITAALTATIALFSMFISGLTYLRAREQAKAKALLAPPAPFRLDLSGGESD